MGILVLGVGLLSIVNPSGSLAMFKAEAGGLKLSKTNPKIKDTAIMLWGTYIILTFADIVLLKIGGMSIFDAINHALSTISTGGFSTKNDSMGAFKDDFFIIWITTVFMFLSGITFLAHIKVFKNEFAQYKNDETRYYFYIFVILSFIMTFYHLLSSDEPFFTSLTYSFFNIATLMTTTGFVVVDYESWGVFAVVLAMIAMIISANSDSTAGGIKVIRFIVSFKMVYLELKKIIHPNAVIKIFVNKDIVSESIVTKTLGFVLLFALSNFILALYLYICGYDFLTSCSAAVACIGNIGPGFGDVGPVKNYSIFSDSELFVLSIGMIIGRLEVFTFLVLFLPSFWKKF